VQHELGLPFIVVALEVYRLTCTPKTTGWRSTTIVGSNDVSHELIQLLKQRSWGLGSDPALQGDRDLVGLGRELGPLGEPTFIQFSRSYFGLLSYLILTTRAHLTNSKVSLCLGWRRRMNPSKVKRTRKAIEAGYPIVIVLSDHTCLV
jgi:hypothetical protein